MSGIYATERQKYDLSGYIADGIPMVKKYGDKEYSIQKYQGEHSDEYVVMEVENGIPNGLAQLFKRGLIQLSWRMVEGNREGLVRVYKNGKVSHEIAWETLDKPFNLDVFHEIINDRSGQRLMVEKMAASGTIVYKGGYDPLTMSKEGYGIEYDEESGVEKSTGFYRNNILIHLYQSFIKEEEEDVDDEKGKMKMIEYDGNESINNVDNVLNLHPIYVGGYRYDEKKNKFVRYGKGNVINKLDGICNRESVWNENGDEIEDSNTELYGGWYGRFDNDEHGYSIRVSKLDEEMEKKRIEKERYWNTEIVVCAGLNLSYTRGIEELVTGTCFMNNENKFRVCLSLNLSSCERLKRVDIGNRSLKYIREFVVDGLNQLESVRIGDWCLCISGQERDDGIFKITNCPKLRELYIGDYSCIDYSQFIVSNVDSLQSIKFIRNCFQFAEKCTIKDLPALKTLLFEELTFEYCHLAILENLPELTKVTYIGALSVRGDPRQNRRAFINGGISFDNTLIMRNLPSLTSIQGFGSGFHQCMGTVILDNIPNLTSDNIKYGNDSFAYTRKLKANNASALTNYILKMIAN